MISENILSLKESIEQVCAESQRNAEDITVVLVTKLIEPSKIAEAYNAGMRDFGENKVQELLKKISHLPSDIRWHFVGHLQRNKVRHIIRIAALIHSVDSIRLAQEIEKQALKANKVQDILVQVNVSQEDTKAGVQEAELNSLIDAIHTLPHVAIRGLMTIGPFTENEAEIRRCFRRLKEIRNTLRERYVDASWDLLSMGMTADYRIAILEGATMLRIGTAIFGKRI